jgi:hypothetical protein
VPAVLLHATSKGNAIKQTSKSNKTLFAIGVVLLSIRYFFASMSYIVHIIVQIATVVKGETD